VETANKPYVPFAGLPQCEAKTRSGTPCKTPSMKNGRCRLHGGKSTGPRTPEGRARCGNWKHGRYSRFERERRRMVAEVCQEARETIGLS
jgi:hypothetical protein